MNESIHSIQLITTYEQQHFVGNTTRQISIYMQLIRFKFQSFHSTVSEPIPESEYTNQPYCMHFLWQTLPLHLPFVRFVAIPASISMQIAPSSDQSHSLDETHLVRELRVTHFERSTVKRTHAPQAYGKEW